MDRRFILYAFLLLLPCVFRVAVAGCGKSNCVTCARSSGWFGKCRWCKRDNECHNKGSLVTPCSKAENIVEESHCDDELSRYDTELSYKMLMLSSATYDPVHPQECLRNALPSSNFDIGMIATKNCGVIDGTCSGYIAVSHTEKAIAISFRGSADISQALAVFVEGISFPKVEFLGGKVQSYWKTAFDNLWQNMESKVRELRSSYPRYQIWITGHSLGGAIASLASTWLAHEKLAPRKDIILYTFGMPRVGDYDYALQHNQLVNNSWRVVNFDDLVPHFPTVASVSILGGPYHHGTEAYYTASSTSVNSAHKECHGKPFNEDKECSFTTFPYSIERHKQYFGIAVGTFWKEQCVLSSARKTRDVVVALKRNTK